MEVGEMAIFGRFNLMIQQCGSTSRNLRITSCPCNWSPRWLKIYRFQSRSHRRWYESLESCITLPQLALVPQYQHFDHRTNLDEVWRYCAPITSAKDVVMDPLTKGQKMRKSVHKHISSTIGEEGTKFLASLFDSMESWKS